MIRLAWTLAVFLTLPAGLSPLGAQVGEPPASDTTGEVRGRVFGRRPGDQSPLPHVFLDFSLGTAHRTVATDSAGWYAASGLAPGKWRVRALHVGYQGATVDVLIPPGGTVELDMELTSRPIPLPPVLVRGTPVKAGRGSEPAGPRAVGEISLRAMEGGTGVVEAGLAQVVRAIPGSGNEADPTDVLLMRGSATDLKLVLLDGAPVYTPFHLGGLVESFDPGALGGASLFLGGAPARYDGGLSYILDLETRSPRRDRFSGAVAMDLLTARALLESPIPGGGLLLESRAIHDLGAPLLGGGKAPYGYGDLLVRGDWGDRDGTRAYLTGYWNREEVRLDLSEVPFAENARWGNQAVTGGASTLLGTAMAEVNLAVSRYDARLPVSDSLPLFARGRTDRVRLTGDLSLPWEEGTFRFGFSVDGLGADYAARSLDSLGSVVTSEMGLTGTSGGAYLEGARRVASNLALRGGMRLDYFSGGEGVRMAPRGSLSWFLTDNAVLTLAAGRYHQFAALTAGEVEETLASTDGSGDGGVHHTLTVGAANHLVVSLDQILSPGLRLGLEGFVKNFAGVAGGEGQRLNASGFDLRVAREGKRASGWLGYTLTWFWAPGAGDQGNDSQFSGRHLLSAGLTTHLSDRAGLRMRVAYGDGLPYSSVPLYASAGSAQDAEETGRSEFNLNTDNIINSAPSLAVGPDEGFLRLEAEIFGSWTTQWGGRVHRFRPYLRVLNALDRRDALFYHFDPWRDSSPRPLAELPVLPLAGLEWSF